MDVLTPAQRHKNMQRIKGKDTKIEVILRKALWSRGVRYRKNFKGLPGTPDIAITKYKIAIFCDGEFFHGRNWNIQKERIEKGNNPDFWIKKIERNIQRDGQVSCCLESEGWSVFRFWGEDIIKHTDYCVGVIMDAIKAKSHGKNINIDDVVSSGGDSSGRKTIYVVAAVIIKADEDGVKRVFVAQRGYGRFKDFWEFPGGKEEPGESPEEALVREIREELDSEIDVGDFIDIIEYDYPDFHLSMECYQCSVVSGKLSLIEHENARWLSADELESVEWLPADVSILGKIGELLK